MESLPGLLDEMAKARASGDWQKLEEYSIQVLKLAYKGIPVDSQNLNSVIQSYLASIIGTGDFLIDLTNPNSSRYQEGLSKLLEFLKKRPHYFEGSADLIHAGQEIALLSLDPTSANRNKISKLLRQLARPDISVIICNQILESTRLNYYTLTVLCGAYCDLYEFDKAIEVAEKALKYSPEGGSAYPLTALVRAHTLKFKATGDISEIELALEYGHKALSWRIDSYAANAFVAAAVASGITDEIAYAQEVLEKAEPQLRKADIAALFQSYQASQALAPKSSVVEVVEEFDEEYFGDFDSLIDLVTREQGFYPVVPELRNMINLFIKGGWFLQGLSYAPCPTCEKVAVHAYRKHFKRYGKEMHYWGLVCNECKYATDSIDFDKRAFSLISKDLESRFPVSRLCHECTNV
jgi:tetratricopeptide (TPR) repeat protein